MFSKVSCACGIRCCQGLGPRHGNKDTLALVLLLDSPAQRFRRRSVSGTLCQCGSAHFFLLLLLCLSLSRCPLSSIHTTALNDQHDPFFCSSLCPLLSLSILRACVCVKAKCSGKVRTSAAHLLLTTWSFGVGRCVGFKPVALFAEYSRVVASLAVQP